jgi:cysteine-rich repeat protein/parallel beta-helix repeat protein
VHKKFFLITIAVLAFLGLMISPQEWASATVPPPAPCDVTLISGQNIQTVVDAGGPKVICLQGTFKQSVTIGPEDTATGSITIQGVSPGGIMDGQNGVGPADSGASYLSSMDAFELLPGVKNVTIRDLEIKDYIDPSSGTGQGNAVQAWGPYSPGVATSNVNIWNNNMHGFSWNGILVGNSGTGLHSNWSVEGNTIVPCWIGIELTNTSDSVVEGNTVSGGGCFTPPDDWVIGIMLQARNIASEGGSGSITMSNVSVKDNTIVALGPATSEYGIYLLALADGPTATLSNIKVGGSGNKFENNETYGIVLYGAGGTVDAVSIMDNDILSNDTGIRVVGTSTNVTANFNNISGNTTWGARNSATAVLNAEFNWWGNASGPGPVGSGTGDNVSNNVDYYPWLKAELKLLPLTFYWKDYNDEDPGGYMSDIDQNQNFSVNMNLKFDFNTGSSPTMSGWIGVLPTKNYTGPSPDYGWDAEVSSVDRDGTFDALERDLHYKNADRTFIVDLPKKNIYKVTVYMGDRGKYFHDKMYVYAEGKEVLSDIYTAAGEVKKLTFNVPVEDGQLNLTFKDKSTLPYPQEDPNWVVIGIEIADANYCAPVAEANSLWWLDKKHGLGIFEDPENGVGYFVDEQHPDGRDINGDGQSNILDLVQDLAEFKDTNGQSTCNTHTGTTVADEQTGIDDWLEARGLYGKLYEHTVTDNTVPEGYNDLFEYIESEVERCQDVKLDLGFWHILDCIGQPGTGQILWQRVGGHAVTVAGVDSPNLLLAISDPDNDAAEGGAPGVVRPVPDGHSAHPNDPTVHNIEANASHDIYAVGPSPSPGGKLGLIGFPGKVNFPEEEWVGPIQTLWPEDFQCYESKIVTEIEAAVIVSPPVCGNGVKEPGEECDDGNTQSGDGCSSICKNEYCGDGILQTGEQCDDGNNTDGDGCTANCKIEYCGDGTVNNAPHEKCDDGNNQNEDGCSSTCQWEVVVIQPNGGELIPSCSTYTIKWLSLTGSPATKFKLLYTMDNEATWTTITSNATGASYNWSVPKPGKNKTACKILVKAKDGSGTLVDKDKSDSTFSIVVVQLTSPNGGETLTSNTNHTIRWTTNCTKRPVKHVYLYYTDDGGASWKWIIGFTDSNPGSYVWKVPSVGTTKTQCKVKLLLLDSSGINIGKDKSDAYFTIKP